MILDHESAERWLAVQQFRSRYFGIHPDEMFGPDGWEPLIVDGHVTGIASTPEGDAHFEQVAKDLGPSAVALFDQLLAEARYRQFQQGTEGAPTLS